MSFSADLEKDDGEVSQTSVGRLGKLLHQLHDGTNCDGCGGESRQGKV